MSTTMTLSQLRTEVRNRADQNGTNSANNYFITDSELNSYINQSYFELYDLLVQKYGDDYYVATPVQFQTNGSSFLYPLPDGVTTFTNGVTGASGYVAPAFLKLLGVDLALANQTQSFVTLKMFMFGERNRYAVPNFQSFYGVTNMRYRLQGNYIWFTPIPMSGQIMQLWYIPRLTTLSSDSDTADGISGWTEYIIVDAAIKCLAKEESDPSVFMQQKQALIQRIESAAENRNAGDPAKVVDSQFNDFWWGSSGGWGSGNGSL